MTINTQVRTAGPYVGTGLVSSYPFSFKLFEDADLLIVRTVDGGAAIALSLGPDYSVSLNADQDVSPGGVAVLSSPLAVGQTIGMTSKVRAIQPASLTNNGGFYPKVIENGLDRLVILDQQQEVSLQRSLRIPELVELPEMPAAAERAGKLLGFNAEGDPSVSAPASGSSAELALALASAAGTSQIGHEGSVLADVLDNLSALAQQTSLIGVTPSMFSDVGPVDPTGVVDSTSALQAWADSPMPKFGEPGRFKVSGTLEFSNPSVDFKGMVVDGSAGGAWVSAAVVLSAGSLVSLPSISGALTKGVQTVDFSTAHGLENGDVFVLYNPTDYSWSTVRSYYREGEFCRVMNVTSSTQVSIEDPLFSGYGSGTLAAYKLTKQETAFRNLTVLGPASAAVVPVKVSLGTKVRLENVQAPSSNYLSIGTDRCFDVELQGCTAVTRTSALTDSYGLLIGNCQRVRVYGGSFVAPRGGFDIGGDSFIGCVPSRDVKVDGALIANDPALNFPACDLHGNLEGFAAYKCRIRGGASFAGLDNEYLDCDIDSDMAGSGALVVGGSEWLGGKATIRGGSLRTSALSSTNAVVRTFSNSYAKQDTILTVLDVFDVQAGANTSFVKTEMSGSNKVSVRVDGVQFSNSASLTQVVRMQGSGSAGDGDFVIVDRVSGAPAGASLYIAANGFGAATPGRLMSQRAESSVVMSTSTPQTSVNPITWRYSYGSKVPQVLGYGCDTVLIGTKRIGTGYRAVNATSGVVDVFTADNTNCPSAATVTGFLAVGLDEL